LAHTCFFNELVVLQFSFALEPYTVFQNEKPTKVRNKQNASICYIQTCLAQKGYREKDSVIIREGLPWQPLLPRCKPQTRFEEKNFLSGQKLWQHIETEPDTHE
jgi:hypothetical protein